MATAGTRTLPPPCYILSDAHLGVGEPWDAGERSLLAFLRAVTPEAGSLVINGDLFDFWFEWRRVIPRTGFRILAALADLHDRGVPILWIAGNHDCWGGDVLRKDVGVDYHVGPWDGTIGAFHTRIEHGDGLRDKEDRRYRAFRAVARNPLAVGAFRLLPPDFATRLATGSSHASRTYSARDGGAGMRRVAEGILTQHPDLDLLVLAHSHVATLDRVLADHPGIYANAGAWLAGPGEPRPTFLTVEHEAIALRRWPTGAANLAEAVLLHRLDRVRVGQEAPRGG
jgi:UDP-2,3-diacylglucosamine hydrolase